MRIVLTDPVDEENAYPIPCLSWLLVYKNQSYNHRGFEKYKSLVSFLNYIICPQTQKIAGRLTYSPLPSTAIEKAQKLINSIEWTE
jgi:phosphate transport system substrate-binding protein